MGVTIHYAGQLKDPSRMNNLLEFARGYAETHGWGFELIRGHCDPNPRGFVIVPHSDCENLEIRFGLRFKFEGWVKTQFAGTGTHIQIVRFLREISSLVGRLGVRDEGEYWTTGNVDTLAWHMKTIDRLIAEAIGKNPKVRKNLRTPDGKIIDLIE